jgi:hypothetical protein
MEPKSPGGWKPNRRVAELVAMGMGITAGMQEIK